MCTALTGPSATGYAPELDAIGALWA